MSVKTEFLVFSQNIRLLREQHGYSPREMAKLLHISVKTLLLLESGALPDHVSSNIIFLLSRHFNIPPKDLFSPSFL